MKKTVYRYYDLDCEIGISPYTKHAKNHAAAVSALRRDMETLNTALAEAEETVGTATVDFDTMDAAQTHLKKHAGTIEITDFHGDYVRVHGGAVEELEIDGDDAEFIGTVLTSELPRVTVANDDDHEIDFTAAVNDMDDEIREELHAQGIDDPQEFFDAYCAAHEEKFGDEFVWNKGFGI